MTQPDATERQLEALTSQIEQAIPDAIEPLQRLTRDLKSAAANLRPGEVRYLVQLYYEMQEQRIRSAAQVRESAKQGEPNTLLTWMYDNYEHLEADIRLAMYAWTQTRTEGRWLTSLIGIGPVIAAGHMAHIDIQRADSPAHIWRLAGADPTQQWTKGQKRPWNAQLKVLRWKAGQSFVKTCNNPRAFYGPLYSQRKRYEQSNNEAGRYAEQARAALSGKRLGADTVARQYYERGLLPPAHIQARAERWASKLFLSHLWSVLWDIYRGEEPKPAPYAIAHLDHVDLIAPPNWPVTV